MTDAQRAAKEILDKLEAETGIDLHDDSTKFEQLLATITTNIDKHMC